MKKLQQYGFSVVEGLLVVIAVTLIAFVGYYVWHTKSQTSKTLDNAKNTSDSTRAVTRPKTDNNKGYFVIKEWGVRAPYMGNLNLEYTISSFNGQQQANFISTQLKASDPEHCTNGIDGGGLIMRYAPSDTVYAEDGMDLGTATKYFANYDNSSAGNKFSHVGSYYYQFIHVQAPCSENTDLVSQTNDAVNSLIQNLQAIPK